MLAVLTGDRGASFDVNRRESIVAILYLAVVGPCVFILQPGFVQGLVQYLGLTEQQAGYVASAEMFGIATTTVLLAFVAERVSWRRFLLVSTLLAAVGNIASIGQTDANLLAAIRFLTGLGSGGIISLSFTMAGLTARTDRNFGLIIVWVLIYGALGLLLMPSAYQIVGMNGVLAFFGLFCASSLYFIRFLPDSGHAHADASRQRDFGALVRRVSLFAIFLYNVAIGVVWAYLFLVGLDADMAEQAVANALTASQFLGIAGAFLVVVFEQRIGRVLPLAIGIAGTAAFIYGLVGDLQASGFWIAVCGFNFLWNLSMPYLLAILADFDYRGRTVVHGVSMQMLGLAVGPFVAAQLLARGGFDLVNSVGAAMFIAAMFAILPGALAQRRNSPTQN